MTKSVGSGEIKLCLSPQVNTLVMKWLGRFCNFCIWELATSLQLYKGFCRLCSFLLSVCDRNIISIGVQQSVEGVKSKSCFVPTSEDAIGGMAQTLGFHHFF